MNPLRRIAPRSLFWRSFLIVLIPLVLLQAVVVYIFFERHWDTVSRQLAVDITGDVVTVKRFLRERPEPELQRWIERIARSDMQFDIVFEEGAILPDDPPKRSNRLMDRLLHQALGQRITEPFHVDTRRSDEQISIRIQQPDGVLTMLTPAKRMRSSTTLLVILWMVGTAIFVSAIAMLFLRNQIRPIKRLAVAADALGKGRPVPDLKPAGAAEIRRAAFGVSRDCRGGSDARSASVPKCWLGSPTTCERRSPGSSCSSPCFPARTPNRAPRSPSPSATSCRWNI